MIADLFIYFNNIVVVVID
ncbi:unnamed protein product, partial [Rotaria magnacalcarata]